LKIMRLTHTRWPQVLQYLQRCRGIIIPTGSTEQHGPIGPIGTDALLAQAIAEGAAERGDWLVAPTLNLGPAQFNLGFPGTVALRASTLMAVVGDVLDSLAVQGFERFYFLNAHGANIAAVNAACQDFYAQWSLGRRSTTVPQCRLRSWWDYPRADQMRKSLYGSWEGMHATPSELAMAMAVLGPDYPHDAEAQAQVSQPPLALPEGFARLHGGDNHLDSASHRAQFPDGRVGSHSALARIEDGQALMEAAIADAQQDIAEFFA
jgi:creatinine amidohydrolase